MCQHIFRKKAQTNTHQILDPVISTSRGTASTPIPPTYLSSSAIQVLASTFRFGDRFVGAAQCAAARSGGWSRTKHSRRCITSVVYVDAPAVPSWSRVHGCALSTYPALDVPGYVPVGVESEGMLGKMCTLDVSGNG